MIKYRVKSYRADNAVDDATIDLPNFVLFAASPEGVVLGSELGTWIDGFGIERLALPSMLAMDTNQFTCQLTTGLPENIEH
jgi:hypothetical protein